MMQRRILYSGILVIAMWAWNYNGLMGQGLLDPQPIENFYKAQERAEAYFQQNPDSPLRKHWERKKWMLEPRLYPSGDYVNLSMKTRQVYERYLAQQPQQRSTHGTWSFLGPTSCSVGMGRVNALALHPTNADLFYIAASSGGLWKTTDGGTSWQDISPNIPLLAFMDIEMDPSNPNVLYALAGDGDPRAPELFINGEVSSIGVIKSTDGGMHWYETALALGYHSNLIPHKLLVHPTDGDVQYITSKTGILYTTDGWGSIDTVTTLSALIFDIEFKPGDPTTMYATSKSLVYSSLDSGITWNQVSDTNLDVYAQNGSSRLELALAPNSPNSIYVIGGNGDSLIAVCRSSSGGQSGTWARMDTSFINMGKQASYNMVLAVDPVDPTHLYGGLVRLFRTETSGVSWNNVSSGLIHGDFHDVQFAHGRIWAASDGGVYSSADDGVSWTEHSQGLAITEIYRIAGTPQNTDLYFAGTQDNGTMRRATNSSTFEFVEGGDGMECAIDPTDQNNVYVSKQNGVFFKSTTGGGNGSFTNLNAPGGKGTWTTPMFLDHAFTDRLWIGKDSVYWLDATLSWNNIGRPLDTTLHQMAQAPNLNQRMYVSAFGNIVRTDNTQTAGFAPVIWEDISAGLPNLFITGITVHPTMSGRVFVTLSGYNSGQKVYMSDNAGVDWTNLSGSLPAVPVNCIVYHDNGLDNDALYIGTDIGVFYRDNDLGDWIYFSNTMPAVSVADLYINTTDNTITAGTYGRGLWQSDLYSGCIGAVILNNTSGQPLGGTHYHSVNNTIFSNVDHKLDLRAVIHYRAGDNIILTQGFEAGGLGFFEGTIGPCPGNNTLPDPMSTGPPTGINMAHPPGKSKAREGKSRYN